MAHQFSLIHQPSFQTDQICFFLNMRSWRNGRRTSLRGWREQSRGGSSPLDRTIMMKTESLDAQGIFLLYLRWFRTKLLLTKVWGQGLLSEEVRVDIEGNEPMR